MPTARFIAAALILGAPTAALSASLPSAFNAYI
jgi:hypothetical protein